MDVLIVIVNYRSSELAVDCLRSLEPEVLAREGEGPGEGPGAKVVVVENASGLDQAEQIGSAIVENGWESWASMVVAPRNGGFASGNNVAITPSLTLAEPPRFVWLLNPDTIVRPGALAALRGFFERRPDVGLAGSRMEDPDGTPQRSAFRFPSILGELEGGLRLGPASRLLHRYVTAPPVPEEECRVDWVAGASLMIRLEVFRVVGLLDEGYFMYFEEVDFCLKAARLGWPCWYVPASRVVHLVGRSSGVTSMADSRKRRPRYWFDARKRFFRKNHGLAKSIAADLTFSLAFASFRLRRWLQRKPDQDPQWMLWDFLRYNFLPTVKR